MVGAVLVVVLLMASATSCGDDSSSDDGSTGATSKADGAYPMTVSHGMGEATIEAAPERIVTLGYGDEDPVAALGVTPIGVLAFDPGPLSPWFTEAVDDADVETVDITDGIPLERVAALEPDLIVALGQDLAEKEYDALAEMAPTIAWQTAPFTDPWRDVNATVGKVLDKEAEAAELVADTEATVADVAADHPEWKGKTVAIAIVQSPDEIGVIVTPDENTVALFSDLGMELAPGAAALEPGETGFSAFISREQLASLEADLLILRPGDDAFRGQLEADPLFQSLDVVQAGHVFWPDAELWLAFRTPSVLAIPYALDRLVPALETIMG